MTDPRLGTILLDAHPSIEMTDLIRATDINVICEGEFRDSDGETFWVYTIAGELDGNRIEQLDHVRKLILGATVAGDAMIIHGKDRQEADWIAINGVMDSIDTMRKADALGVLDPDANAGIITETRVAPKAS
jgi:hypothetical protein